MNRLSKTGKILRINKVQDKLIDDILFTCQELDKRGLPFKFDDYESLPDLITEALKHYWSFLQNFYN